MTDHPITPPPELVREWCATEFGRASDIATQAARWGADHELDACCEWLTANDWKAVHKYLRAARRPKPPSLKQQALDAWDRLKNEAWCEEIDFDLDFVRRALEQLND